MTVKELKEKLNKYDENKEIMVFVHDFDSDAYEISYVSNFKELDLLNDGDLNKDAIYIEAY